ncbi:MAG: Colicin production protein [Acidobacteriales bacterium]|nr:Colicin production protein [Terriglobales bacterium]
MALVDWIIIAVLLISVLVATAQGFFFEVFSLAGAVFGYILAAWEYWRIAPWFEQYVKSPAAANAAGFITIFISVMVLASIAGKVVRWALHEVGLRWVDRLLGAAFGLIRGIVLVTVAIMMMAAFAPESEALKKSELSRYFLLSANVATWVAPSDLRQKFRDGLALLRKQRMELIAPPAKAEKGAATSDPHNR